jgi:myo-inositol 2-dehydrogenase/D-chiro-inositol 1-dehydrogenase
MSTIQPHMSKTGGEMSHWINRRTFIRTSSLAAGASALGMRPLKAADAVSERKQKIKLGLVGCGGRGSWIASLFQQHGGFEFHAVADYFQAVADKCGDELGVDRSRRFSTLSGYRRLIESGVEAVALEVPPYFFAQHAQAAVEAGLHVYMAKPIAADVPGCLAIQQAAKTATEKQRCFLVDYQMPTDPANIEVRKRILAGGLGKISQVSTIGICSGFADPPLQTTIENRLQELMWVNDIAMGCDYIGNFDIHAIDAALWALGQRPVAAVGASQIARPNPHGDAHDVCSVIYEYADGLVHNHFGQALPNQLSSTLTCTIHGQKGYGTLEYWKKAEFRSDDSAYRADVKNLYEAGAARNIDDFYRNVTEGHAANDTVSRAVDSALTCILGREAAARGTRLTMEQILAENRKLEVNLAGLKT